MKVPIVDALVGMLELTRSEIGQLHEAEQMLEAYATGQMGNDVSQTQYLQRFFAVLSTASRDLDLRGVLHVTTGGCLGDQRCLVCTAVTCISRLA